MGRFARIPGHADIGPEDHVRHGDHRLELARRTAALLGAPEVEILGKPDQGWNPGRYVPSTARIRADLGVTATIGLDDTIRRTALSNGWKP